MEQRFLKRGVRCCVLIRENASRDEALCPKIKICKHPENHCMGEKEEGLVMCKGHSPHAVNVGMSAKTSLPAVSLAFRDPDCPHPRRGRLIEAGVANPACIAQPVLPLAHCSCPVRTTPPNARGCGWVALRLSRPSPDG